MLNVECYMLYDNWKEAHEHVESIQLNETVMMYMVYEA
jgi:hypothetical protein